MPRPGRSRRSSGSRRSRRSMSIRSFTESSRGRRPESARSRRRYPTGATPRQPGGSTADRNRRGDGLLHLNGSSQGSAVGSRRAPTDPPPGGAARGRPRRPGPVEPGRGAAPARPLRQEPGVLRRQRLQPARDRRLRPPVGPQRTGRPRRRPGRGRRGRAREPASPCTTWRSRCWPRGSPSWRSASSVSRTPGSCSPPPCSSVSWWPTWRRCSPACGRAWVTSR